MKQYIYNEQNGLWYELWGDYYIPCLELPTEKEERHIGVWGQRHLRYIREHKMCIRDRPYSQYHHNGFEDNADAHLKRTVMGREVVVAVTNGKLDFGTWEQIFYFEFDGMRTKHALIKIIGE